MSWSLKGHCRGVILGFRLLQLVVGLGKFSSFHFFFKHSAVLIQITSDCSFPVMRMLQLISRVFQSDVRM